jgi:predicted nucleic acid-binding protein
LANILVDTHIYRQFYTVYQELLNCISSSNDTLIVSNDIDSEYQGRHRPTLITFISYRIKLGKTINIKQVGTNRIKAKYKRYKRTIIMPKDCQDHKWVKTAISEQAKHIISNDPDLSIPPFRTNGDYCTTISPTHYIQEYCSD